MSGPNDPPRPDDEFEEPAEIEFGEDLDELEPEQQTDGLSDSNILHWAQDEIDSENASGSPDDSEEIEFGFADDSEIPMAELSDNLTDQADAPVADEVPFAQAEEIPMASAEDAPDDEDILFAGPDQPDHDVATPVEMDIEAEPEPMAMAASDEEIDLPASEGDVTMYDSQEDEVDLTQAAAPVDIDPHPTEPDFFAAADDFASVSNDDDEDVLLDVSPDLDPREPSYRTDTSDIHKALDILRSEDDDVSAIDLGRSGPPTSSGEINVDFRDDSSSDVKFGSDFDIDVDSSPHHHEAAADADAQEMVFPDDLHEDADAQEMEFPDDVDDNYDDAPVVKDSTSEEKILPTIGIDEEGNPISATDLSEHVGRERLTQDSPAKAAPRARRGSGILMGFLGLIVGAGGFAGAWFAGVLPEDPQSLLGGDSGPVAKSNVPPPPPAPPVDLELSAEQALAAGNPLKALEAFDQLPDQQPEALTGRGQARWLVYVQEQSKGSGRLDGTAAPVAQAREDLTAATEQGDTRAAARAQLWLGAMEESLGNLDNARDLYEQGLQKFPTNAAIFTAALNRLDTLDEAETDADDLSMAPSEALLAFVVLLQLDEESEIDVEPGMAFWEASAAMRKHDYPTALAAIRRARVLHDQWRDNNPGRSLYPLSDPRNQIFELCCRHLEDFIGVRQSLADLPGTAEMLADRTRGYPAIAADVAKLAKDLAPENPDGLALSVAVANLRTARDQIAMQKKLLDEQVMDILKQINDAGIKDEKFDTAVVALLKDWKSATDTLTTLTKDLTDAGFEDPEVVPTVGELIRDRQTLALIVDRLNDAGFTTDAPRPDRDELTATLTTALAKANRPSLDSLLSPSQASVTGMTAGIARAITLSSQLTQAQSEIRRLDALVQSATADTEAKLLAQKTYFEKLLSDSRQPAEMLPLWIEALASSSSDEDMVAGALADAQRVADDENITPAQQAQSLGVQGLASRAKGEFDQARSQLASAKQAEGFDPMTLWGQGIDGALKELTDPSRLLSQMDRLTETPAGKKTALEQLDLGLKIFPANERFQDAHAAIRLKRAELLLDSGAFDLARADAEAAINAGSEVEGVLVLAKAAEFQGRRVIAQRLYRRVIEDAQGSAHQETRREARLGLTRSLLGHSPKVDVPTPPAEEEEEISVPHPALILLMVMLNDPIGDPGSDIPSEWREALTQAEAMIADGDARGHLFKADVLSRLGKHGEALREYAAGLAGTTELTPADAAIIRNILARHPQLQRPDQIFTPDPFRARAYFGQGVDHFYAGRYAEAENSFLKAIRLYDQDARFVYFLGLSRWMLDKHEFARADFKEASMLERRGMPSSMSVGESLQRIQGPLRFVLDQFRP